MVAMTSPRWRTPDGRTVEIVSYADDGRTPALTLYRVKRPNGIWLGDANNVAGLVALGVDPATLTEDAPGGAS